MSTVQEDGNRLGGINNDRSSNDNMDQGFADSSGPSEEAKEISIEKMDHLYNQMSEALKFYLSSDAQKSVDEVIEIKKSNDQLGIRCEQVRAYVSKTEENIEILKEQLIKMTECLDQEKKEHLDQKRKNEKMINQLKSQSEKDKKNYDSNLRDLKNEAKTTEYYRSKLRKETSEKEECHGIIKKLQLTNDQLKEDMDNRDKRAKSDKSELRNRIKQLEKDLKKETNSKTAAETRVEELKKEVTHFNAEQSLEIKQAIKSSSAIEESLRMQIDDITRERDALKMVAKDLRSDITGEQQFAEMLQKEKAQLKEKVDALKLELHDVQRNVKLEVRKVYSKEKTELQTTIEDLKLQIESLQTGMPSSEKNDLTSNLTGLKNSQELNSKSHSQEVVKRLCDEKKNLTEHVATLTSDLLKVRKELNEANRSNDSKTAHRVRFSSPTAYDDIPSKKPRDIVEDLIREKKDIQEMYKSLYENYNQKCLSTEKQALQYEQALQGVRKTNDELKESVSKLKSTEASLRKKIGLLETRRN